MLVNMGVMRVMTFGTLRVIERLNHIGNHVNQRVAALNSGGCCVYAVAVAKHLQNRFPTRIVAFDDVETSNVDACTIEQEFCSNGSLTRAGHFMVEFDTADGTYWHDATGTVEAEGRQYDPLFEYLKWEGALSVEQAEELIQDEYGWNIAFDWHNDKPRVEKMVNLFMRNPQISEVEVLPLVTI